MPVEEAIRLEKAESEAFNKLDTSIQTPTIRLRHETVSGVDKQDTLHTVRDAIKSGRLLISYLSTKGSELDSTR